MRRIGELDREFMLWLNGHHADWLDPVMLLLTKTWVWIPLYAVFLWLLYRQYKRNSVFIVIGIALAVTLADRITTGLMKPYFARLRPTHQPEIQDLIHTVGGYYGGQYGFASSHAANVFAAAFILWLVLRAHYRWALLVFVWAIFISYTRVYLGVHYPGDILGGALIGIGCGMIGYFTGKFLIHRYGNTSAA